jgi:hypothetical protein
MEIPMTALSRISLAAILAVSVVAAPVFADGHEEGATRQGQSLVDNTIKAFAYDWYARFDNGPSMDALLPNLPDETVEFIYPQATITTIADMTTQFEAAWATSTATAHYIEELMVYGAGAEDVYDVIVPHTYYVERSDGSYGTVGIVSRMRVQLGLETALDPTGENPKLVSYLVNIQSANADDASDPLAESRIGDLSDNDAKAFVHQWFANTDARDVAAMVAMTSSGPLNVNLLGTEIGSRADLQGYMELNSAAQSWAVHQPTNITVTHTDEGFAVRFVVHFEGNIEGFGDLGLSNVTNWLLVEEDGELRLRDYSLALM